MEQQKKYYITQSNLKKLVYRTGVANQVVSDAYDEIYDEIDLRDFVSSKEAQQLAALAAFLKKSEQELVALAAQSKPALSNTKNNPFVFLSGSPKYHKDETCETLSKDFENFEIPEEIKMRGENEIQSFRDFAKSNRKLINDGREDVFLQRLKNQFRLRFPIDKVSFSNSGQTQTPQYEGADLCQLSTSVKQAFDRLAELQESEEGAKALRSHRYAPLRLLREKNLGPTERLVLERKRELIDFVTKYIVAKYKPTNGLFSQRMLQVYGFEPCAVCCDDEKGFDLDL